MNKQEIQKWQNFLIGFFQSINKSLDSFVADGLYGPKTTEATKFFQQRNGLIESGQVDSKTLESAKNYGFYDNYETDSLEPYKITNLSNSERESLFGKFSYKHTPVSGNMEAITITDNWAKNNLISIKLPGTEKIIKSSVTFHKIVAEKAYLLFERIKSEGLSHYILSWDGSYVPRFVRGSTKTLSNHAWGTAFDINASWNPLGSLPAKKDQKGTVIPLVKIANECGFFWGGHFNKRPDGMHFEFGKKI